MTESVLGLDILLCNGTETFISLCALLGAIVVYLHTICKRQSERAGFSILFFLLCSFPVGEGGCQPASQQEASREDKCLPRKMHNVVPSLPPTNHPYKKLFFYSFSPPLFSPRDWPAILTNHEVQFPIFFPQPTTPPLLSLYATLCIHRYT